MDKSLNNPSDGPVKVSSVIGHLGIIFCHSSFLEAFGYMLFVPIHISQQHDYGLFPRYTGSHSQDSVKVSVRSLDPIGGIDHGSDPVVKLQVGKAVAIALVTPQFFIGCPLLHIASRPEEYLPDAPLSKRLQL